MTTYTTIRVPSGALNLTEKMLRLARREGMEVRAKGFHEFVLVEDELPPGVRRLPARPRPVASGPDMGGAA